MSKIDRVTVKVRELESNQSDKEILRLSKELDEDLEREWSLRKMLKEEHESVIKRNGEAIENLREKEKILDDLPRMVGKMVGHIKNCYEQFTGSNLITLDEAKNLESCPRQLNTIYYKIQDFITANSEKFNPGLEELGTDDASLLQKRASFAGDEEPKCLDFDGGSGGGVWSKNLNVTLKEIEDTKLLRYLHQDMVNLEINLEGLTARDSVL